MRIDLAPVADAQCDDSAEQKALVGDRIENRAERTALIGTAGDVAIEAVANRGRQKYPDRGEAHPILRTAFLDAFAVIDRERDEDRDHQDPDHRDFVGGRHERASQSAKLGGRAARDARQFARYVSSSVAAADFAAWRPSQ